MAICGECGSKDNEIKPDDSGMCGKCEGDFWVEWRDFFDKHLDDWIKKAMNNLKMSKWQLAIEVIDSENMTREDAIKDIFNREIK